MKEDFIIQRIPTKHATDSLLKKHYAHRVPPIMYTFGLYRNKELEGVCTFGMPTVLMNNGGCIFNDYNVQTLELNRLVVNEGLGKNVLSYFITSCFQLLPKPLCLVSFTDPNHGHHGYIYQATNWIYTGISEKGGKNFDYFYKGRNYHGRGVDEASLEICSAHTTASKTIVENWESFGGKAKAFGLKHRYFMFLGNKKEKREMIKHFRYNILQYPKGDNTRYEMTEKINTQNPLI